MISETKLDESFPSVQFLLDGYCDPFRFDRDGNGGGILLYIRDDIPSKLLSKNKNIEGFFVELNLLNKKNGYSVVHIIQKKQQYQVILQN